MTHAVQTLPAVDTRKVFVTCHQAVTLPPRHVDERIAAFLKEKVLPVVGDHCRINLHWNGVELSSLHIRSVVPDQCALVPKAVQNRNAPMTALSSSAVSYNGESIAPAAFSPNDIKNEPVDINDEPANVKSEPVLNEVDAKMEFQSSPQTLEAPLDRIISARVTAPSPPKVRASAKLPVLLPKPYPSAPPQPLVASVATIPVVTYGQAPFTPTIFAATTGMAGHIPAQILHLSPSMSASPYSPYGPVQLEESRSVLVNATGPAGERPALTSRIFAPPQQCSATQNAMQATRNTGSITTSVSNAGGSVWPRSPVSEPAQQQDLVNPAARAADPKLRVSGEALREDSARPRRPTRTRRRPEQRLG
ncbi:hypothetical protein BIW11_12972 [Tropilaelaps mercedesae]|uniref:Uncharacterized protein n=1 Tax=Tropilaelaps mercedesae TaxID=418985 RepID=A0A1V9X4M0_9ACAR|nr:hypothetical protein BIW11_12972 [Tropilaelaps mercedesae]